MTTWAVSIPRDVSVFEHREIEDALDVLRFHRCLVTEIDPALYQPAQLRRRLGEGYSPDPPAPAPVSDPPPSPTPG